jgi:predicted nucleotidyltransferase
MRRVTDPNMPMVILPKTDSKSEGTGAAKTPANTATTQANTPATTAQVATTAQQTLTKSAFVKSGDFSIALPKQPDVSVLTSLWGLDQAKGPVNGDQLAAAIQQGVGDLDGKAATEEYKMFADWAKRNDARLSPEAKQVMDIYKKFAEQAQKKGQTGIPLGDFKKMIKEMKDVKDVSVASQLSKLDKNKGPINGDQMADAIRRGTADRDGKAASDEYKQFADWAKQNEKKLSPEAKQVLDVYKKYAEAAQAKGQSGIPDGEYRKMLKEMNNVRDSSTTSALKDLDKTKGPINGDQMAEAIKKGVEDKDGKGASDEYKQFADWAKKNEKRLSPEAKQVLEVYTKYAKAAQAKGQAGIPDAEFQKMVKEMNSVQDASVAAALSGLDKNKGPITGDQMAAAIKKGTQDKDGKGATDEFKQFADWAKKNEAKLSPEAKQVLDVYKKYAEAAQAKGQAGIPDADFKKMVKEMNNVRDAGATAALAELDKAKGPINGDQMAEAIKKGIEDKDGKGASDEYKQFADWAKKNEKRLSPEAKQVLETYTKYAKAAQAKGQAGIPDAEFQKMVKEMNSITDAGAASVLAGLDKNKGPINGDQMAEAIKKGVEDKDGKAATDEYKQFADWAKKNESRLSPEAKQVLDVYKKYAEAAQAKGSSGITDADFQKMVKEMNSVQDASVTSTLAELDKSKGPVNGDQMAEAIKKGVEDLDGKAATDEYKQFADWAQKNQARLSPEAKQVLDVYKKYAEAAQGKGQKGITDADFQNMVKEMNAITDSGAAAAIAELDGAKAKGQITPEQLTAAIKKGTEDLDGKAATDEYKQFADWAKQNEGKLTPEAKKVLDVYKKYAEAAQAKGSSGITQGDYNKMLAEMSAIKSPPPGDASVNAVLSDLDKQQGPINGDQMTDAISRAISDKDGNNVQEYNQIAEWAKKNEARLSPEAKEVLGILQKFAEQAKASAQNDISDVDFRDMIGYMNQVRDTGASQAVLDLTFMTNPVSGEDMMNAIRQGTEDLDGKSATDEFTMFADFAKANPNKLTPEAKAVMDIYEKYAKEARAKGQSGIPLDDWRKMLREMDQAAKSQPATHVTRTFVG